MTVSIVRAHRPYPSDAHRERIAAWTRARAEGLWPDPEILDVDSGHQPFNHAASLNRGARDATGDILVLMDDDTTVGPSTMREALAAIADGASWVMARRYRQLTADSTAAVLGRMPIVLLDTDLTPHLLGLHLDAVWEGVSIVWAGFVVIRRADFLDAGGYDERLDGWAPDDVALGLTLDALVGSHVRVDGTVFHLWHEPAFEREHGWTAEKRRLLDAYAAAAEDPDAIRAVRAS